VKLKRKKKLKIGQGLSLSLYSDKKKIKKKSSEMLDYFTNINLRHKKKIQDEYNFHDPYRSPILKKAKNKKFIKSSTSGNKFRLKKAKRIKKELNSLNSHYPNSQSNSYSIKNKVSIPRTTNLKSNEKSYNPENYSIKMSKSPKKYKITSLAQLLKTEAKSRTYSKNEKNSGKIKKNRKNSKNKFRITSKANKTKKSETYKGTDNQGNLSNYLKISTIKPFNIKLVSSDMIKKNKSLRRKNQRNINQLNITYDSKIKKKKLESYGFLEYNSTANKNVLREKKGTDYFFKSQKASKNKPRSKCRDLTNPIDYSPNPEFKFISSKLSKKYKENLSKMKKKQLSKNQKLIKHVNDLDIYWTSSNNKLKYKTPKLKSFKLI
jgi:hypothetical protein